MIAIDRLITLLPGPLGRLAKQILGGDGDGADAKRGALAAFAIRVVSAGIAFMSQVLLARWIGVHEFGIFTYVWVLATVVGTLCALGFSTSAIRFIPEYRSRGHFALTRGFLLTGRSLSFMAGLTVTVAGMAFLLTHADAVDAQYRVPIAIGLLCLPAFALTDFQDGVGRAEGWIDLALGPPYIFRPLLILLFVAFIVAIGWTRSAETAVQGAVIATWLTVVAQFVMQKQRMQTRVPDGERRYRWPLWFKVSLPLLLLEGFTLMMTNLDILLLNIFVSADHIALYFAAARTISLIGFVHFAITAVAMPQFTALAVAGDNKGIRQRLAQMRAWTLWPSLAGAAMLLILGKPLLWLFGPAFTDAYPVMLVLAGGLLAMAAAGPVQGLLVVTGHQNVTAIVLAATVFINAALNLALIPYWGLLGAAAATSLSLAFQALVLHVVVRRVTAGDAPLLAEGRMHGAAAE